MGIESRTATIQQRKENIIRRGERGQSRKEKPIKPNTKQAYTNKQCHRVNFLVYANNLNPFHSIATAIFWQYASTKCQHHQTEQIQENEQKTERNKEGENVGESALKADC